MKVWVFCSLWMCCMAISSDRLQHVRERIESITHRDGWLIDLGANCGNSYLKFREEFEKQHRREHFTYVLFEPNPKLYDNYLRKWENQPDITLIQAAGWIHDGVIEFYLDSNEDPKPCDPHSNKNPQGASSIFKDEHHPRSGQSLRVRSIDVNAWILVHVKPEDYCVLKVDIEGGEYELLRHLMVGGSLQLVDELYVEFHEPYTHKAALQWMAEAYSFRIIKNWH